MTDRCSRPIHKAVGTIAVLLFACFTLAAGELRFDRRYTDNMVLQRGKPIVIRGYADKGTKIMVSLMLKHVPKNPGRATASGGGTSTVADANGQWAVTLPAQKASGVGGTLMASTKGKTTKLQNIAVGDVYLLARQTGIDVSLGRNAAGKKAAAAMKENPLLRVMRVKTIPARKPERELDKEATSGWAVVNKGEALRISGTAFYLGTELAKDSNVPIGIIDLDMGSYFAIGWLGDKALKECAILHPTNAVTSLPERMLNLLAGRDSGNEVKALEEAHAKAVEQAQGRRRTPPQKPSMGLHPIKNPTCPSVAFNAVIPPLSGTKFKGVLLQLGNDYPYVPYNTLAAAGKAQIPAELNQAWGQTYYVFKNGYRVTPATLPYIPKNWRKALGDETIPFGLIMPPGSDLIPYAQHNREVRELQRRMLATTPGLGLIMAGPDCIPLSGQPKDEQLLARRCLAWVQGTVLAKEGTPSCGPLMERIEYNMEKATVHFRKGTAIGLEMDVDGEQLFEVAGPDQEFFPATGKIKGSTVILTSDKVGMIRFARYNWQGTPGKGLVNGVGLPAIPFNNADDWEFAWIVPNPKAVLPEEYVKPANEWQKRDVAIIKGSVKMLQPGETVSGLKSGDSEPIPSWIGPTGIYSKPFGRSIIVIGALPDSPGAEKVQAGDLIYSVNGKIFGDDQYRDLANAITHSETEAAGGKLVLGVRRKGKLMDVELELTVLGSYSSTTPYYCPKSERIARRAEEHMQRRFRPTKGSPSGSTGFLNSDIMFMLAAGTPKYQGIVRRAVYELMAKMTPLTPAAYGRGKSNWPLGHNSLLFAEYYHATGDRNVLPYLKNQLDWAVLTQLKPRADTPAEYEAAPDEMQVGGWRHNGFTGAGREKSGYGLLAHAGMGCVMSMVLAKEAGMKIDEKALRRGLNHFRQFRAEHGHVIYSYYGLHTDRPKTLDPNAEADGNLWSHNGTSGMAASLFNLIDDHQPAQISARQCVYAFNNTRSGHGGMYFNNFWTPIGAHVSGEKGYKHFIKGQTWWRELYRRHDGSYVQAGRGGFGVAYAIHRVAPRKNLRILGAAKSAYGTAAPTYLKPALAAHARRDYALAEKLVLKEMDERIITVKQKPIVQHFLKSLQRLRASIDHDLTYVEGLLQQEKDYRASLELAQLRGVLAENNPRLAAIAETLATPASQARAREGQLRAKEDEHMRRRALKGTGGANRATWEAVVSDVSAGEKASKWRMKVVEVPKQAPKGWETPQFDDSTWPTTTHPISWQMYHTILFRTKFNIADKTKFDTLRLRAGLFQQLNCVIYINGTLVAKIDDIGRGGGAIPFALTDLAYQSLKNGENTITVLTRHNRRWGSMRGKYTTVGYGGVSFMLDARVKDM